MEEDEVDDDFESDDERSAKQSATHFVAETPDGRYRISDWAAEKIRSKHRLKIEDVAFILLTGKPEYGTRSGSILVTGRMGSKLIRVVVSSYVAPDFREVADFEVITAFGPND